MDLQKRWNLAVFRLGDDEFAILDMPFYRQSKNWGSQCTFMRVTKAKANFGTHIFSIIGIVNLIQRHETFVLIFALANIGTCKWHKADKVLCILKQTLFRCSLFILVCRVWHRLLKCSSEYGRKKENYYNH